MKWCENCVLPDSRPNLVIGPDGICNACTNHGSRESIDWAAREDTFKKVVVFAKERGRGAYNCVIPVSGGKDSTWQTIKCLEYGLNPLCVTWRAPGRTDLGEQNLKNLIGLGVDHMDFTINPDVERYFMKKSLDRSGDPAIPMHMALFSIPLRIAVWAKIPLVMWGENSAFEYGGTEDESRGFRLDERWLKKYGVTQGTTWKDWTDDFLTPERLSAYCWPSGEELGDAGVLATFLGYYLPWDPDMTRQVAKKSGFSERAEGPVTGYYNFADIDDNHIAVHHWFKWYKFGFTRLFDNLSIEIRNGRLSRAKAIDIIAERGQELPVNEISELCSFLEISEDAFFKSAEKFRNPAIWQKSDGVWRIPDFLIPDWNWSVSNEI